jgi:hypothetical protein
MSREDRQDPAPAWVRCEGLGYKCQSKGCENDAIWCTPDYEAGVVSFCNECVPRMGPPAAVAKSAAESAPPPHP